MAPAFLCLAGEEDLTARFLDDVLVVPEYLERRATCRHYVRQPGTWSLEFHLLLRKVQVVVPAIAAVR
jgi:hypothetical protein